MTEYPIPGPAYRIVTPRLVLRCWRPTDAQKLLDALTANHEHLSRFLYWALKEPTDLQTKIEQIRTWQANFSLGKDFGYGVFNRDESQVLGGCGLHIRTIFAWTREIGYWIHKDYNGQGLATELAGALTKVGFEVDRMQRIEIRVDPENAASLKVIRKAGYTYEGTLRGLVNRPDGTFSDRMVFSMLASEYPSSPSAKLAIEAYDAFDRKII